MIALSPKKHLEDSKRHRERITARSIAGTRDRKQPRSIPAGTVAEWQARGGVVEVVAPTWSAPTRYPCPNFSRGKGGIG